MFKWSDFELFQLSGDIIIARLKIYLIFFQKRHILCESVTILMEKNSVFGNLLHQICP